MDTSKIVEGIKNASLICQCEVINRDPIVIIDGAHNPEGMKKFCDISLLKVSQGKPIHVIFACCKDKNLGGILSVIGETTNDLTLTTFDYPAARGEEEFFLFAGDYKFEANPISLLKEKMEEFKDDCIIVTGSEFFASQIRKQFIR